MQTVMRTAATERPFSQPTSAGSGGAHSAAGDSSNAVDDIGWMSQTKSAFHLSYYELDCKTLTTVRYIVFDC